MMKVQICTLESTNEENRKGSRFINDNSYRVIQVAVRFSAPVQTEPGAHPALYKMGTGSFPGVKRPGRGVDHPPPSSVDVKERVELYIYSPSGPSWLVIRRIATG
jgi:hypothetical protein